MINRCSAGNQPEDPFLLSTLPDAINGQERRMTATPLKHTTSLHKQKEHLMKYIKIDHGRFLQSTSARRIRGQGLTEYVVIVSLIAIASIVAVSAFGSTVKTSFLSMGTDMVGGDKVDRVAIAKDNLEAAEGAAKAKVTLKNYND